MELFAITFYTSEADRDVWGDTTITVMAASKAEARRAFRMGHYLDEGDDLSVEDFKTATIVSIE